MEHHNYYNDLRPALNYSERARIASVLGIPYSYRRDQFLIPDDKNTINAAYLEGYPLREIKADWDHCTDSMKYTREGISSTPKPMINPENITNDLEAVVRGLHGLSIHVVKAKNEEIMNLQREISILKEKCKMQSEDMERLKKSFNIVNRNYEVLSRSFNEVDEKYNELQETFAQYQADVMLHLSEEK